MKNKLIKILFLLFAVVLLSNVKSQNNPGFSGKKKTFGYNLHIPIFKCYSYVNNEIYMEFSRSRTESIAINFSYAPIYQKYYLENYYYLNQFVKINGFENEVDFSISGGYMWLQMYGLGAKYCFFKQNNTISSPIGFSFYFKGDIYFTNIISKNLEFYLDENVSNSTLKNQISNDLNKNYNPPSRFSVNCGMGVETKRMLTSNLFFKAHLETNISSNFFKVYSLSEGNYKAFTDYLSYKCYEIPLKGNFLVAGIGLGVLF